MYTRGHRRRYFSIRSGFTVVELLIVVVVVVFLVAIILPQLGRSGPGTVNRQLKCSTQVRGMMQGMVIWAQSNADRYPLPSIVDKANDTIALAPGETPQSKDTSANIMSILIFNGYIPTEMCVSPGESKGNIKPYEGYMFSLPPTASKPGGALWDPAFNADFTGPKPGGLSYAHQLPCEVEEVAEDPQKPNMPYATKRLRWGNSFSPDDAAVGNRGPQIKSVDASKDPPRTKLVNPNSNTYLIHGGRTTWEGNIGFNDCHVDFVTTLFGSNGQYRDSGGTLKPDCLFFDEPDAGINSNNFLGIFVKGGPARKDFVAIWD